MWSQQCKSSLCAFFMSTNNKEILRNMSLCEIQRWEKHSSYPWQTIFHYHDIKKNHNRVSLVVQRVKDPALSLPWWRFDPWPRKLYTLPVQLKKKKKNRNSGKSVRNFQLLKIFCLHCSNESFLLTCISLHLALKKEYLAFVKFQVLQVCII